MTDVDKLIELLAEGDEFVQFRDEAVVVIGNAGSCKSAAVHFIASEFGISYDNKSDEEAILETHHRSDSSPQFPTLFPYKDQNFYDCPSFDDAREKLLNIAAINFMGKLIRQAYKVKFVLMADYSSIMGSSKTDFVRLLERASLLVKDWSKFAGSTFLVAVRQPGFDLDPMTQKPIIRPMNEINQDILNALLGIRKQLEKGELKFQEGREALGNALKLIDSLAIVKSPRDLFPYMSSLRLPDSEEQQKGRAELATFQIYTRGKISFTKYVTPSKEDFGCLSDNSISDILQETIGYINEEIKNFLDTIATKPDYQAVNSLRKIIDLKCTLEPRISELEKLDPNTTISYMVDEVLEILITGLHFLELKDRSERIKSILKRTNLLITLFENGAILPGIDLLQYFKQVWKSSGQYRKTSDWDVFLIYLYLELSSLNRQSVRKMYDVHDLSLWGKGGTPGIFITHSNVAQFMEKLKETIFNDGQELPDPSSVTDLKVNEHERLDKLNKLNEVLSLTVKQEVVVKPDENVITIKQNIICLSDVVEALKEEKYNHMSLKLFASDTIYVDCSLDRPSCDVTLIAPIIKIFGEKTISVKGLNKASKANTSVFPQEGHCIHNGGNFLAITMSSLDGLTVDISGGAGQSGQADEIGGEEDCHSARNGNIGTMFATGSLVKSIQIEGKKPIYGQGSGSEGGMNGRLMRFCSDVTHYKLYALEKEEDILLQSYMTAFNDDILLTEKLDSLYDLGEFHREITNFEAEYYRLRRARNIILIYRDLLKRIQRYSETEYEKLNDRTKKSLQVLYTAVLSKVGALERGFQRTLVTDIREHIKTTKSQIEIFEDNEYTRVLIKEKKRYGDNIKKRIDEAKFVINTQLSKDLDNLIESTKAEIPKLLKEVAKLEKDTKEQIEKVKELEKQLRKAATFTFFKNISKLLFLAGPYGQLAGSVAQFGIAVGECFNKIKKEPLNVASLPGAIKALNKVTKEAKESANKRIDRLEKVIQNLQNQIDENAASVLVSTHTRSGDEKKGPLSRLHSRLSELMGKVRGARGINNRKRDEGATDDDLRVVELTLNEVEDEIQHSVRTEAANIEEEESSSESDDDDKEAKTAKKKKKKFIKDAAKVIDIAKDTLTDFSGSLDEIHAAEKVEQKLHDQLKQLELYRRQVSEFMTPMIKGMGDELKRVEKTLSEKSQVVLDVAKWKIQSKLREFKRLLENSTSGFGSIQEEFGSIVVELSEGMTTIIGIYDRIQTYKQQAELADYIANMNDRGFGIDRMDGELADLEIEMRLVIRANIILDRYEACVQAVKQWVFPFAVHFLGEFELPHQLKPGQDVGNMIWDAKRKIDALSVHISDYYTTTHPDRKYVRHGCFDNITNSSFFTWKNDQYSGPISKLLSGEEVLFLADPAQGSSFQDAIKFNKIKLNFRISSDRLAQEELDLYLKSFNLQLTHMGNSYYRFKNKIYVIESNEIPIIYSISKGCEPPVEENDILKMLRNGDILLSPYAMWKIQLTTNLNHPEASFEKIKPFAGKVDLELLGEGNYLDESFGGVPDLDLESFYTLDRVLEH